MGMLITGTINTLFTKIQFTQVSVGVQGKPELFSKPWFSTWNMMFAMMLVGIVDQMVKPRKGMKDAPLLIDEAPGASPDTSEKTSYTKKVCLVAVPAAFDIVATALCAVGMLYIQASVWQMLRGSSIIFAAMLSVICLKRKLHAWNYLGLALCVVGVTVVGYANVLGDTSSGRDPEDMIIGMSLVIAGQVVQAAQVVAEEFLMKSVDLPPLQIVGWEGFWGTLMMMVIVYPILWVMPGSDNGHQEDPIDTWVMIKNSKPLAIVILTFMFSCATFNATGIAVTAMLSSIHRMMMDASRTLLIWAFGLFVHYYVDKNSPNGEVWTEYSWLQLVGFVILVTGQSIYGEVLKVPCFTYPKEVNQPMPSPAAARLATPLPRSS